MTDTSSHKTEAEPLFDAEARRWEGLYRDRGGCGSGWGFFGGHVARGVRERMEICFSLMPDLAGKRVLETGCGSGDYGLRFLAGGAQWVGVDASSAMLGRCRARLQEAGYEPELIQADLRDWQPPVAAFDVVLCVGVLGYLRPREAAMVLDRLAAAVAPGGRLVTQSIAWDPFNAVRSRLPSRVPRPLRLPGPLYFHRPRAIRTRVGAAGLENGRTILLRKYLGLPSGWVYCADRPLRRTISEVVRHGACVRCGACVPACPAGSVALNGKGYPQQDETCVRCGICFAVCPAGDVNLPGVYRQVFGATARWQPDGLGCILDQGVGHSTDARLREESASGGVVTQIASSLLARGQVEAVLTVAAEPGEPLRFRGLLATDPAVVRASCGSKYAVIPVLEALHDLDRIPGRLCVIGLPCHLRSLRLWQARDKALNARVTLTIGLFCHAALEEESVAALLRRARLSPGDVTGFEFRHGTWPGGIHARDRGGIWHALHPFDIKDGAFNVLSRCFTPEACRSCTDMCAELADLAVGDPWLRGETGDYLFPNNQSLVLVRTDAGARVLSELQAAGDLVFERIPRELVERNFGPPARAKLRCGSLEIRRRHRRGIPFPEFHLDLPPDGARDRLRSVLHAAGRAVGHGPLFRRLFLAFWFSAPGRAVTRVRRVVKRVRFRRRAKTTNPH